MSILANGLAIALGGLMYEDTVSVSSPALLLPRYSPDLKMVDGTGDPFNPPDVQYGGRTGVLFDSFYRMESNQTAMTALPVWTDQQMPGFR